MISNKTKNIYMKIIARIIFEKLYIMIFHFFSVNVGWQDG